MSKRTIEYIESGERRSYRGRTIGAVEAAFSWPPGFAMDIVAGKRPDGGADELLAQVIARWPALSADERKAIVDLVEVFVRQC